MVLRMLKRANRASHIDPPASSYAIMRRACAPTAERTLDPARMFDEELDPRPGIREQPRPWVCENAGAAKILLMILRGN